MKYKLICVDIDGTLLDDDKKLLPQVKKAIADVAKMGIQIALVSGRMPAGVDSIEKELGVPCIKVCNAGAYMVLGDQCIYSEHLLPSTMKRVYEEIAEKNHVPLWIFREKEWFVTEIDRYIEREIKIIQYQPKIVTVDGLAEQWTREETGPNKVLIAAEPKKLWAIYQQMKEQVWTDIDIARSADIFLEIFPKGMSKGKALTKLCNQLNIDLAETIAFGDHELDIPMIEAAGLGIAMGNAIEELKEKADFVTKANNEAGIAYALERYLLKEGKEDVVW